MKKFLLIFLWASLSAANLNDTDIIVPEDWVKIILQQNGVKRTGLLSAPQVDDLCTQVIKEIAPQRQYNGQHLTDGHGPKTFFAKTIIWGAETAGGHWTTDPNYLVCGSI